MPSCIFCPNPRTTKRGEHVWDDWINREAGKDIRRPSTAARFVGDVLVCEYPTDRIEMTADVVCDPCNHEWMSDLSSHAKTVLEPSIHRDERRRFDELDILTVTAFAFLKSAVLDWSTTGPDLKPRIPCLSRAVCTAFRHSLTSSSVASIALPAGLQVWMARYRRTHAMEARAVIDEMTNPAQLKGYKFLSITYVVGSFIFQLTYPRWTKRRRNRPAPPFLQVVGDHWAVPIWPRVTAAYWPPLAHVDSSSLQRFCERFRTVAIVT